MLPADVGRLLVRFTVTVWPSVTIMVGPGTCMVGQVAFGDRRGGKAGGGAVATVAPRIHGGSVGLIQERRLCGQVEGRPSNAWSSSMSRRRERRHCNHYGQEQSCLQERDFHHHRLIIALLVDVNFSHQPAEVLLVVRQVIELRGEEIEDLSLSDTRVLLASRITSSDSPPARVIELV